ncbi:hypothetical protein GCM10009678_80390 [Actinomadura kijaniata]|uniref:Uncharacterized protein n=1 Tax=Actinomadura namibiensis TaxID=182080 RepID=A0A7W3QRH1_ACTNM|nr:hypothetical protein [Actinomadura namibiensis]MBA8956785.1 hypothetical protein [Actinomadura namibiensis]
MEAVADTDSISGDGAAAVYADHAEHLQSMLDLDPAALRVALQKVLSSWERQLAWKGQPLDDERERGKAAAYVRDIATIRAVLENTEKGP